MEIIPFSFYFDPSGMCTSGLINIIFISLVSTPAVIAFSIFVKDIDLSLSVDQHDIFVQES